MFSAITGAIGALKGPLHGGANEEAMKAAEEIGSPENAPALRGRSAGAAREDHGLRPRRVPHHGPARHHPASGSRARSGERHDDTVWADIFEAMQETVYEQKQLWPNVDLYAAGVYHVLGIPTDLMTPIFALARMAGWTAHVREQYADNKVIRPGSTYVGPRDQVWVPIDDR